MKLITILLFNLEVLYIFSQPKLYIQSGSRLNSNNITSQIVFDKNVCLENNTTSANINLTNVTVKFSGAGLQYIGGNQSTPFYNLRIAKTGTGDQLDVYLNQHIQVNNQLYMESGYLDLRNYNVTFSSTASIQNESATSRVKATNRPNYSTPGSEGEGTGYITTTRTDPSGNVANLGLDFTPVGGNLGNTEIRRGHQRLSGSGSFTGNKSISRYYRIIPTTMRQLNVNKFYYLKDGTPELFSHPEANLQMFQQVQYVCGTCPIYWEPRTTTVNSGYVTSTTTSTPIMLNYILITLGSTTNPLPVEYLAFNGYCKENINTIYWQTASEINNYGFIVEKSHNATDWIYLTFVAGNGTTNSISNYYAEDNSPFSTTYYRLKQIDNDGSVKYSNVISVQCHQEQINEDFYPGDNFIVIQGTPGEEYQILFTNVLGQQLFYKRFILSSSQEIIPFFEHIKTTGIYYVTLLSKNKKITKPILYQTY